MLFLLATIGNVATNRLKFDQFLLFIKKRSVGPMHPGCAAIGTNDAMVVLNDRMVKR